VADGGLGFSAQEGGKKRGVALGVSTKFFSRAPPWEKRRRSVAGQVRRKKKKKGGGGKEVVSKIPEKKEA